MTRTVAAGLLLAALAATPAAADTPRTRCTADPVGRTVCWIINTIGP